MASLTADFNKGHTKFSRSKLLVIISLVVVAVIAAGGFYYSKNSNNNADETVSELPSVLPSAWLIKYFGHDDENSEEIGGARGDPDGDILTNQQEYLFGTDPTNMDTDGDGEIDGFEVAFGSNPLGDGEWELTPQAQRYVDNLISSREEYQGLSRESVLGAVNEIFQPELEVVFDLPSDQEMQISANNSVDDFEKYFQITKDMFSDDLASQDVATRLFNGMSAEEIDLYVKKVQAVDVFMTQVEVPSELLDVHRYKVAGLRAGIRMLELARDNNDNGEFDQSFWPGFFHQSNIAQQAGIVELASWYSVAVKLRDTGGLPELEGLGQ